MLSDVFVGAMAERRRGGAGAPATVSQKELSVIVPTYNETENIRPLAERLFKATEAAGLTAEMLIVDDESPGTEETAKIVKALMAEGLPVRMHCRTKAQGKGLSSAVLLGFKMAKYPILLCMDADLQHEPESVPAVAQPVMEGTAEFAIGSRHVEGGGVGFEWSPLRRAVSFGATLLAWFLAPSTDPMSGFFCVSKVVLQRGEGSLNPIGFKIGLEIMVRCRCKPVKDVAITFQERNAGESKLSAKTYRLYLEQLISLYIAMYGPALGVLSLALLIVAYAVIVMTKKPSSD